MSFIRSALVFAALGVPLVLPAHASGHSLVKCSPHQVPRVQMKCGEKNVHAGVTSLKFLDKHPHVGTIQSRENLSEASTFLIKYGNRHTEMALARMLPPHYNGWNCIHSREGPWDANTGNGYYGGLQAHYDWYGVARMDLLSPLQQMWHAENTYQNSGYSSAWLHGQWPNTYPPCAGFF
jgi:hypothetical protein